MFDPSLAPQMVGTRLDSRQLANRQKNLSLSSRSASDLSLSEALSDMSLSTSPGSDMPSTPHNQSAIPVSSGLPVESSTPQAAVPPRKRMVVRQLSSNPYLASSEMSPSEDHPIIMGSSSYAAGDSRYYWNETSDHSADSYHSGIYSAGRASSYPLTSDCIPDTDEESIDDEDDDDLFYDQDLDPHHPKDICDNSIPNTHVPPLSASSPIEQGSHYGAYSSCKTKEKSNMDDQPSVSSYSSSQLPQCSLHSHNSQCAHNNHTEAPEQQHHSHCRQQQDAVSTSTINTQPLMSTGVSDFVKHSVLPQEKSHEHDKKPYVPSSSAPHSNSASVNGKAFRNSEEKLEKQSSGLSANPQSREINSWGHFSKPTESHYKYRRRLNTSGSDDENESHPTQQTSSFRRSHHQRGQHTSKSHPASTCLCSSHHSPAPSPNTQLSGKSKQTPEASDRKDPQNGMEPQVFKDRFLVMKEWFSECNHGQKNVILKGLLGLCELPQLHLLSVHMSKELHHGCPSNCEDILTWLPSDLAIKVISYLDPVSLCRAAQVCRVWRQLAEDQSLWRRFCCQAKWRLSKAAEHKQVISHMCPEGSIQWKNVFAERFRLRNNWLKGRCTVRTFEGHHQGISCVQFDDSRIVSGSSDKTIKVWNMRTNAPWSVQTLMGHHGTVRCLHLEGNRLVSGSCDATIKVWDLSTQESWSSIACKVTMTGHSDTVRCLQADDDKVISGSYDKTLKIWDLKSGELRRTLRGHHASVLCVHFSETKIVSGSADKTIKVWNYEGRCMRTLRGHQDAVTCLMFDSTRIVSGSLDHNLKFWDLHSGECLNTIDWKAAEGHTDVVRCLQADSWRVVSAGDDKTIKVWNLETGERLVTLRNHTDGVTCLQFNDFIIVSGSYDKSVKLWDFSCC